MPENQVMTIDEENILMCRAFQLVFFDNRALVFFIPNLQ